MRKTLRASVFVLALCAPVFAGDIPCPSITQPPPSMTAEEEVTDSGTQSEAADSFTETVLSVLETVLALL
jgi:hypothetical protein